MATKKKSVAPRAVDAASKRSRVQRRPATRARQVQGMSNAERSAHTRTAVMRAAAECFDEAGYLATRLDDITSRAKLTKGAVYFHFGSKEALAVALISEQREHWPAVIEEATTRPGTPLDHLVQLTYDVVRDLRENVNVRAGVRLAAEPTVPGVDPADLFSEWTERVEQVLRRARRAKALAPDAAPQPVARVIVAFLLGAAQLASITRAPDLRKRLDEFWGLVLPALRATPR